MTQCLDPMFSDAVREQLLAGTVIAWDENLRLHILSVEFKLVPHFRRRSLSNVLRIESGSDSSICCKAARYEDLCRDRDIGVFAIFL